MIRQERLSGWLFVAPTLVLVLVLAIGPIVYSLGLSFFIHDLSLPQLGSPFVGLDNYRYLLRDSRFWYALYNTIWFTITSVGLETVLGLLIALMINQAFFGRGLVRATILIPWAVPTVVGAQMWRWIYNDKIGVLNDILRRLGILSEPFPWIASIDTAAWAVVGADVWKTTPFMALLLLAGLQTIPDSLYEAAEVDGADTWQQFWSITLPNLRPVMLVALLFRTLDAFRIFDLVYVLTGGAFSTETLSVLTADVAFGSSAYGLGSAYATVTFLCVLFISWVFIRWLGTEAT